MRIAILTSVFLPEFGVARVVASQLPFLVQSGMEIDLYACELDRSILCPGIRAVRVPTHLKGLRNALIRGKYDVVIAHTDPFYLFLAENDVGAVKIGYEHGYPPVELCLPEEHDQRLKEIRDRLEKIYPNLDCIVTISHYAVQYIQWPAAKVIYNGADHYTCDMARNYTAFESEAPIVILAVTRFRRDEWQYKGLDFLCQLKQDLGESCRIVIAGRGDNETTQKLCAAGIEVVGVVSDRQQMWNLYTSSDAVVSFSACENFNLPLVEAGFAHRPGLAFKIGPHEEVTPYTFGSYEELRDYLKGSTRESLRLDGERMFSHVESRFRWKDNAKQLVDLIQSLCPSERKDSQDFSLKYFLLFWNVREFIRKKLYKKLKGFLCG